VIGGKDKCFNGCLKAKGGFAMTVGCFADKLAQPSASEIETVLGQSLPLWTRLIDFIAGNYQMAGDLSYGGKNYGWNFWYRKSGKALVSLYPQSGSFVAQVVLGKEQVEKALALELGAKVGGMLRDTPQLHDGKWLFIPMTTEEDVRDVEQLLLLKKRPLKTRPEK
jgi:hypothetical protein